MGAHGDGRPESGRQTEQALTESGCPDLQIEELAGLKLSNVVLPCAAREREREESVLGLRASEVMSRSWGAWSHLDSLGCSWQDCRSDHEDHHQDTGRHHGDVGDLR